MLITPEYLVEQKRLHSEDPQYAKKAGLWAYMVSGIANVERCYDILDYGCGKGELGLAIYEGGAYSIPFSFYEYDPAVEGKNELPEPVDLVVCLDVLEHIEPNCLQDVLNDLARVTKKFLFVAISGKLDKMRWLKDGRNAHLIVRDGDWWAPLLEHSGFKVKRTFNTGLKEWVALLERVHTT